MTSSILSIQPGLGRSAYSITKAGINGLARSVSASYGRDGIRCNAVAPGYVLTDAMLSGLIPEERLQQLAATSALGRMATPDEVGAVIAFLAFGRCVVHHGTDDRRRRWGHIASPHMRVRNE